MHRSGTSLVSSLVQALGVFGGEESERIAGDDWNARGYFEVQAVLGLNQRLLLANGYDLSLPPIELGTELEPGDDGVLERDARSLVESFAARGGGRWVWKDPRFSLTLPWWRPLLGRVVPILCLRHPSAIAASLERRDRFPTECSVRLWEVYLRQALWSCKDLDFLPIRYDDAVRDPAAAARRIGAFLVEKGVDIGEPDDAAIAELAQADLRHFDAADDSLLCPRQQNLLQLAGAGRVDAGFLRETEDQCLPFRADLLELTVLSLRQELSRSEESLAFHREQAERYRSWFEREREITADERAFLREQIDNLQGQHDALLKQHHELQAWVEERNRGLEWWKQRSEGLEARLDELRFELEEVRQRPFLRRLFPPRSRQETS